MQREALRSGRADVEPEADHLLEADPGRGWADAHTGAPPGGRLL